MCLFLNSLLYICVPKTTASTTEPLDMLQHRHVRGENNQLDFKFELLRFWSSRQKEIKLTVNILKGILLIILRQCLHIFYSQVYEY